MRIPSPFLGSRPAIWLSVGGLALGVALFAGQVTWAQEIADDPFAEEGEDSVETDTAADEPVEPAPSTRSVGLLELLFGIGSADDDQSAVDDSQDVEVFLGSQAPIEEAGPTPPKDTTHVQTTAIQVASADGSATVKTFCLGADETIFALVAPGGAYGEVAIGVGGKAPTAEVHVLKPDGSLVRQWDVPFLAQRIGASPNGEIYVAGAGRLAKYSSEGELLSDKELPNLAALPGDDVFRAQIEEEIRANTEQYAQQVKSLEVQREAIVQQRKQLDEAAPAGAAKGETADDDKKPGKKSKRTKARRRAAQAVDNTAQRELLDSQIEQYDQIIAQWRESMKAQTDVDSQLAARKAAMTGVNSVSITDTDVFVVTRMGTGYGFSIWRTDLELENPQEIVSNLSGCCGQMDVRAKENVLYVAENSRHRVSRYDRDGTLIGHFGNRDREGAAGGFSGCCNPMNVCFTPDGNVLTAESEGYVKRFTLEGEFLGNVGYSPLQGGCKHVAVATGSSGRVFLMDLPGSRIIVLEPSAEAKTAAGG